MIRLAFMTDAHFVIGASTETGRKARLEALPKGLPPIMEALHRAPTVVVGPRSMGPWLERTETTVYVLTQDPSQLPEAEHLHPVSDAQALIEKYKSSDEPLLVAGGRDVLRTFVPHASELSVAITDEAVPGDIVFQEWSPRFRFVDETQWEGGRTRRYVRRGQGLNNAISLYMHGIRDGRAEEAVKAYTGARYTQHSTGVRDGKEGFIEFFSEFIERTPDRDIQIVRGLEEGKYCFVHAYQSLNGGEAKWVTMDFFELDEDQRIIEHWDVIAAYSDSTPSGHTSVDGPHEVEDHHLTEQNRAVVHELIGQALMAGGDPTRIDDLVAEDYVQHNAEVEDGRAAFRALATQPNPPLVYDEIVLTVGEGNFVATLCKARWQDTPYAQVDLFRLKDGKVVEHWDAAEPVPSPEVARNSGKF